MLPLTVAALLGLACAAKAQGQAVTYTVTSAADTTTANALNCLPNVATGTTCRLRDAVAAANALAVGTPTITFSSALSGTRANPVVLTLTGGGLTLTKSVTITGPGADLLSISGGYNSASKSGGSNVFQVIAGVNFAASGLTLTQGNGNTTNSGGLIGSQGNVVLTDMALTNSVANAGGALSSNNGSLTLTRVTLSGNSAIAGGGAISASAPTTLTDCTVFGNSASSITGDGGGIVSNTSVTLQNSTVTGNSALTGGGVEATQVILINSIVAGNSATHNPDISGTVNATGSFYGNSISATTVPLLAPLGYYGGMGTSAHTQTMPPLPGSPAICVGVQNGTFPATDQRGYRSTTTYGGTTCTDAGSVQTKYALGTLPVPAQVVSGDPITPAPMVALTEQGNALAFAAAQTTSTATLAATTGTLSGTPSTSTLSTTGTLSFSPLALTAPSGSDTLTVTYPLSSAPAVSLSSNATTNVVQPVASSITLSINPSSGVSTAGGRSIVVATVLDQNGQPFAGATVNSIGTATTVVSPSPATTDASGNASFSVSDTTAETATIDFYTGSLNAYASIKFVAPVTFTVTNAVDSTSGAACTANSTTGTQCTLRAAVSANNSAGGGNTVLFKSGLPTLQVVTGQIELSTNVTITGPGANTLSVTASNLNRIFQVDAGVTANISGLTFTKGNGVGALSSGNGGAIYSAGNLNLSASAITGSTAAHVGGGIFQDGSGTLNMTTSTLSGNTANDNDYGGGGVECDGTCLISLSTFTGNAAPSGTGGGMEFNISYPTPFPNLQSVTVTGNSAYIFGGVGHATIQNSVIANNAASAGYNDTNAPHSGGGNVIGSTTLDGATINPKLAPLSYYGGTTQTMPPLPGSPALCTGTQSALAAVSTGLTDERGAKHSAAYCTPGSQVDAGAVQTSYSSVQFVQQPTNVAVSTSIAPSPTVTLTENGVNTVGAAIGMALSTAGDIIPNGQPSFSGTTPQTTAANGLATFNDLKLNNTAGNLHLLASAAITSGYTLSATSAAFSVYSSASRAYFANTVTDNVNSTPIPGAVVTFVATTTNLGAASYVPTVTVTLPTGLSNIGIVSQNNPFASCLQMSATTVVCTPFGNTSGFFNPGASISVTVRATVTATDAIGLAIPVTLSTTDPLGDPSNTATDTLTVSGITVTTLADDATGTAANCAGGGTCTLRDAVATANAAASGTMPTIVFAAALSGTQAAPNTITLLNGQIPLSHAANVTGPGADVLQISGNHASRIFSVGASANLSGLTFVNGFADGDEGAAILTTAAVTLSIADSAFVNNGTSQVVGGGAISNENAAMTLLRCTFTGNAAINGGALFLASPSTITDSTFTGNTAVTGGGAIYSYGPNTLVLNNSTLAGNTANNGGGLFTYVLGNGNNGVLTDNILAGNTGNVVNADVASIGTFTNNGGNILSSAAGTTYTSAQLNFAPLGYYGGHTMTLPALPGSVALCAGVATTGNGYTLPATDQRFSGFARSTTNYDGSNNCVDSGAFQAHYALMFTLPGDKANVVSGESFATAVNLLESGNTLPGVSATTTLNTLSVSPVAGRITGFSGNTTNVLNAGTYTFTPTIMSSSKDVDILTATLPLTSSISIGQTESVVITLPVVSATASTVVPNPTSLPIGGSSTITITAIDANTGALIQGVSATLSGTGASTSAAVSATTNSNGQATFTVTDATIQTITLTATVNGVTLTNHPTITFTAGPTAALRVTGFPSPDAVSAAGTVTVTAQDSAGNTMTGFTGTVTLTSTDAAATLPGSYTFTTADAGVHTFNVTLNTAGTQSITATTGSITGSETAILVTGSTWIVNANGSVSRLNGNGTVLATTTNTNAAGTLGGIAIDNAGDAWAVTNRTNSVTEAAPNGTLTGTFTGAGINTPTAVAIDGLGMVWVANGNNSVSVLSPTGAAVSPTTGYQSTTFSAPAGIAIDQTGSIWVANSGSTTVTRIFGAAAPVVTPLITGTTNGTTGARP